MPELLYLPAGHALQRLRPNLKAQLRAAQENVLERVFSSSAELFEHVLDDLRVKAPIPPELHDEPATAVADLSFSALVKLFKEVGRSAGIPEVSIGLTAANLAERLQLVRAFAEPDRVLEQVVEVKIEAVVGTFPREARDIECGRNPGDVLDPYILSATQFLLYDGDFDAAIGATVSHKALMIVEGLLGHLHEDVLGAMRGNLRAPEPRRGQKVDAEKLNFETNPFPGADLVQPPREPNAGPRFHQIKSKTGSAKGGDGVRLGRQLTKLRNVYGGEIFYDALIGNTLRGHRSSGAVRREAPHAIVLVGEAAFRELTYSQVGPQLLLRVYQAAFRQVAARTGYSVPAMAEGIVATFRRRSEEEGEALLESLLDLSVGGAIENQDSRHYRQRRGRR